jgi:hypothetical protein
MWALVANDIATFPLWLDPRRGMRMRIQVHLKISGQIQILTLNELLKSFQIFLFVFIMYITTNATDFFFSRKVGR